MNELALRIAVRVLCRGGVIAYATESVFGLGCDPFNEVAVARLLRLKNRPQWKGLILIGANFAQLRPLLKPIEPARQETITASWPAPITWVLPVHAWVPTCVRGHHASLAVRVPAHAQARALCAAFGGPLISTSANPSGRLPAKTGLRVRQYFAEEIDLILPGKVGGAVRPSEIRDGLTGVVIRK